jgi:hypothetical protein
MIAESLNIPKTVVLRILEEDFGMRNFFLVARYCARPQSCKCSPIFDPKKVTTLYHPPYSPGLSPPDHFLFPKLKMKFKGLHFADVAEIQEAVTDELTLNLPTTTIVAQPFLMFC